MPTRYNRELITHRLLNKIKGVPKKCYKIFAFNFVKRYKTAQKRPRPRVPAPKRISAKASAR